MDSSGEQSSNLPPQISRRQFLKGSVAVGLAAVTGALTGAISPVTSSDQTESPLQLPTNEPATIPTLQPEEQLKTNEVTLYNDLTPGIGVGVAWNGSISVWNKIVENIIKATTNVNIAPYVFVPRYLSEDFNTFIHDSGLNDRKCNIILCDPEYELSSDAVEIGTGKTAENIKRKGFPSSWVRDWGSVVGAKGSEIVLLDTRKDNMPDPLKGVNKTSMRAMAEIDPGLKVDGGAFFDFQTEDGRRIFLASENEFVNNNDGIFRQQLGQDVDSRQESELRLKKLFGQDIDINLLPSLRGNSVDHIDIYCMPLGGNNVVLGQASEDDPNYEILELVREKLSAKNLDLPRVPIRRRGDNIISWTNILVHDNFIFMPTYEGFERENDMADVAYTELGFEVVRVDATSTVDKGGAVHCATNTSVTAPFIQGI